VESAARRLWRGVVGRSKCEDQKAEAVALRCAVWRSRRSVTAAGEGGRRDGKEVRRALLLMR